MSIVHARPWLRAAGCLCPELVFMLPLGKAICNPNFCKCFWCCAAVDAPPPATNRISPARSQHSWMARVAPSVHIHSTPFNTLPSIEWVDGQRLHCGIISGWPEAALWDSAISAHTFNTLPSRCHLFAAGTLYLLREQCVPPHVWGVRGNFTRSLP